MEEFAIIASQILTNQEEVIYSDNKGVVIKTILLFNPNDAEVTVTLEFDGVAFQFLVPPISTHVISTPILTKEIKAIGELINIHITGLQL